VIRYPRDTGPGAAVPVEPQPLEIGRAEIVEPVDEGTAPARPGRPGMADLLDGATPARGAHGPPVLWLWALGDMLPLARAAAASLRATGVAAGVVNARFIKPLDTRLLAEQAATQAVFATLENGVVAGGFGSAVQEALAELGRTNPVVRFGWPDTIVGQGTTASLMESHGLTTEAVAKKMLGVCRQRALE